MHRFSLAFFSVLTLTLTTGCYHAVIETASPPGAGSIDIPWAHSFLYGLVPPSVVDSADECPEGVARVVTEHSFVNGLAAAITFGLYTPMHINVTCASGSAAADLPVVKNLAEAEARLDAGESFLVRMDASGGSTAE